MQWGHAMTHESLLAGHEYMIYFISLLFLYAKNCQFMAIFMNFMNIYMKNGPKKVRMTYF